MNNTCTIKDLTVIEGGFGCSVVAGLTHIKRSDFFLNLSFPNPDRDGG